MMESAGNRSSTGPSTRHKRSRVFGFRDLFDFVDDCLTNSKIGSFFNLMADGCPDSMRATTFLREMRAGLTTFATMAYIIAVNTGGTCKCDVEPKLLCDSIPEFAACKEVERADMRRDLIAATAAIAGISTFVFGALTNLPVALGPGMGLNAYFAFQVVGINGSGKIPYRTALTAVFFEGLIFVLLALSGLRQWLVRIVPTTIKTATGVGIGFFLTEIGLSYSAGIGAITGGGNSTPLALGGCPYELLDEHTGMCKSGQMTSPKLWLAVFCGGIVSSFLLAFRVKFALIIGITIVSIASWPRNTTITYFPDTQQGNSRFDFFQQIVAWHPISSRVLNQIDWSFAAGGTHFVLALFTFLYVDIIDTTATLYSMVCFSGANRKDGDFARATLAYCIDAIFISVSALLGCSPITAFIESGAGIAEGGRTGLTAITTGLCFIASIFFAPLFASIPPWATGCTLVLVGCTMIPQIRNINWNYIGDLLPSFIVMAFIPLSYSVAYGLVAGIFVYAMLNSLVGLVVWISNGRIEPRRYELKEYWSLRTTGRAPWYIRAYRARRRQQHDQHHVSPIALEPVDSHTTPNPLRSSALISNDDSTKYYPASAITVPAPAHSRRSDHGQAL